MDAYRASVIAGGLSCLLAIALSARLITRHLRSWVEPREQKLIISIVLMVPLFAVDSFVGLVEVRGTEELSLVLDSIKECYEAYVILCFLDLLYAYMRVRPSEKVDKPLAGRHIHAMFPLTLAFKKEAALDQRSLSSLRACAAQFVWLRPVLSLVLLGCALRGVLEHVSTPIAVALNASVTVAVAALLTFYHTFEKELAPHRPFAKFICIKGIVFAVYWQSLILSGLVHFGFVHGGVFRRGAATSAQVSEAIQNLLVCLEMGLVFSVAFAHAFDAAPYEQVAATAARSAGRGAGEPPSEARKED